MTKVRHLTTSPHLALNSIGQSFSLPIRHPLLLLPQLEKVPKAALAVAILLVVLHHPQELLTHHLLLRLRLLPPPPLLLPLQELTLQIQFQPPPPAQPLLGSSHPLNQLHLPLHLNSSSPLPPPLQLPSLSLNPVCLAMALLCPQ